MVERYTWHDGRLIRLADKRATFEMTAPPGAGLLPYNVSLDLLRPVIRKAIALIGEDVEFCIGGKGHVIDVRKRGDDGPD